VICEWLESLSTKSYLFTNGERLPKTCGKLANFSFDYFLSQTKRRLTFYDSNRKHLSDELQSRLNNVRAHLDKLESDVKTLKEIERQQRSSRRALPSTPSTDKPAITEEESNDLETMRRNLAEHERTISKLRRELEDAKLIIGELRSGKKKE